MNSLCDLPELNKKGLVPALPKVSNINNLIMAPTPDLRASDQIVLKPPGDRTLRFRKDGSFHIGVFEDLHFAEGASIIHEMNEKLN